MDSEVQRKEKKLARFEIKKKKLVRFELACSPTYDSVLTRN